MKKAVSVLVMATILLFAMTFTVMAENNEISVYFDGVKLEFDVKPQIINGRTMIPIRAIFEKMGAIVEWDANTDSAICTKGDTVVRMTVNSTDMYINNELTTMDISPVVIGGRTLAPARYAAEAFGANVQWSQNNNAVVICSKDVYAYADYPDIPDLGRCYNISALSEEITDGFKVISYLYYNMDNEDYYSYLYDNSALVLGGYIEESVAVEDGVLVISYTKNGEAEPRYFVAATYDQNGAMIFAVMIPMQESAEILEKKVILYAPDGRTIEVFEDEVNSYLNVGWYKTQEEAWKANEEESVSSDLKNPTADGYYYRTPKGKRYHLDPNCGGKNSYRTTDISNLTPCAKCAK